MKATNKKQGKARAFRVQVCHWEGTGILLATSADKAKAATVRSLNDEQICDYIAPGEYGPWRSVSFRDIRVNRAPEYDRLATPEVYAIEKHIYQDSGYTSEYADRLLAQAFPATSAPIQETTQPS